MPVILPFQPSNALYDFKTTLDGVVYTFDVHWNEREDAYYFDISDQLGNPIYQDIKVMLGVELGFRCTDPRFPPGSLVASDTSNSGIDAKYADLGGRVVVVYYSVADLQAAGIVASS